MKTKTPPAYWIFVPSVVPLIISIFLVGRLYVLGPLVVSTIFAAGPLLRALGYRIPAWCFATLVTSTYWFGVLWLAYMVILQPGALFYYYPLLIVIPIATLITMATTASCFLRGGVGWGLAAPILGAFLLAAFFMEMERLNPPPPTVMGPTMGVTDAIVGTAKCAQDAAASNPAIGFPSSLDGMLGCTSHAGQQEQDGYVIAYQGGPKDSSGKIATYKIIAKPKNPPNEYAISLDSDESGIIWASSRELGGRDQGTLRRYPYFLPDRSQLPVMLADLLTGCSDPSGRWSDRFINTRGVIPGQPGFNWAGYHYEYTVSPDCGVIHVMFRPINYGTTGIRSYLVILHGPPPVSDCAVYATPQDREATSDDPRADVSEMGWPAAPDCVLPKSATY